MGYSFFYEHIGKSIEDSFPFCGSNEAREIWHPIIESKKLNLFKTAFDIGLAITRENVEEFRTETDVLLAELKELNRNQARDFEYSIERCEEILHALEEYSLEEGYELYIG